MSEPAPEAPYDSSSEADRLYQDEEAVPEVPDPEDDPTPLAFDETTEGSEADWIDQSTEVSYDDPPDRG